MIASELISYEIPPLKITDNGDKALGWMEEFKVLTLPVIDSGKYVGIIEEKDILDRSNVMDDIRTYNINYKRPLAHKNQHFFEVCTSLGFQPKLASMFYALIFVGINFIPAYFLYRKKIFIKL